MCGYRTGHLAVSRQANAQAAGIARSATKWHEYLACRGVGLKIHENCVGEMWTNRHVEKSREEFDVIDMEGELFLSIPDGSCLVHYCPYCGLDVHGKPASNSGQTTK